MQESITFLNILAYKVFSEKWMDDSFSRYTLDIRNLIPYGVQALFLLENSCFVSKNGRSFPKESS